ncbi:flagellin lysine-N-methylase [Shewanella fidelis]|uniref:Flagellin lysine-N-methylase n=1 Tax=Shewanella fidelis TaxID=173509 RepID=A0AAW8NVC4_9GAMM|nr:flagellin lysine-N-methylase [Shewanella fidelis]MDR8525909.1 flagellin lysine-N-methylase [Shewanella fidelis]MDW4813903.1 flagellin lysine-N-methylase [Shewanella fidelis]MDW4817905.1 flagellin lysine-N-methylase [Shewanella fidelis]MDW4821972.1 flagellin lysine-N-methylase [Shewanella fidelis]MDW4826137.1 flagellin lysine-N-methylase [Shewanella fidelis]
MKHLLVRPQFVTQFSCIGGDCEDSCCYGWNIHIDKQSYKKTLAHNELKEIAKTALKKVKKSDGVWATAVLNDNGACGFLDTNNLCQIHAKAGESLLSDTCKTYPRMAHMRGGDRYESLSLSCPEAARNILFRDDAFSLERQTINHNRAFKATPLWAQKAYDYSIQLLLKPEQPLELGLTAIGILMKTADRVALGELDTMALDNMFLQLVALSDNGQLKQHFDGFNQNTDEHQMHAFTSIQLWLNTNKIRRGRSRFEQINQAICALADDKQNIRMASINQAWKESALPALSGHPQLFSRYLCYYLYHMQFPQVDTLTPSEAFRVMLLDLFMLRCYLAVIAVSKQGLSEHDIIMCFQVYHTNRQHKANYSQYVTEILAQAKFDELAAILTLLSKAN